MQEYFLCAVIICLAFWASQVTVGFYIVLYATKADIGRIKPSVPIVAMATSVLLMLIGPVCVAFLYNDMLTTYYKWAAGLQFLVLLLLFPLPAVSDTTNSRQ